MRCETCNKTLIFVTKTFEADSKTETVTIIKVAECCGKNYTEVYVLDDRVNPMEE